MTFFHICQSVNASDRGHFIVWQFFFYSKNLLNYFLSVSAKNIRGSLNSDLSNLISSYKFY